MTAPYGSTASGAALVVSGIGVVTPWTDQPEKAAVSDRPAVPGQWFDHRTRLGPRGYKYLPPASQFFLAAAKYALVDADDDPARHPAEQRGAAVGTNSSAVALHDGMDRTVLEESADALSPVAAPYFSINLFGSRLATEHGLKGFNLTLTTPRVAGLESLETGARAVAAGRATWLLAGATEEALPEEQPGHGSSERGAVALVLEPADAVRARGGRAYGRCQVSSHFLAPASAASAEGPERARRLIDRGLAGWGGAALGEAGAPRVIAVVDGSAVGRAVVSAVGPSAAVAAAGAGALEPLLQVAAALTELTAPVLVVASAPGGNLSLALLTPAP
ncbi:beta-ketoacyl synthase N-terminal-like domain-containing protein [Streptomyces albipurpureus]|uniref:3-oxoacyl-ACP synthase n=1 Tax=Streptomyces albipurpureus TaxID=2897419 RepID=A0ABT0UHY2_9ACTN|nr:beta-ketoacyl synthase N-terminal-like domain-containing protein [Streptomyces sp. CWNU-1]MCM2387931.1 3-oxoacyl-ACP synthase [Streptomyces sp. CWNU-1]